MSQSMITNPNLSNIKEFYFPTWPGPSSVTIPLKEKSWQSGIIVGNTNGGGNYCNYIQILTQGDIRMQSLVGGALRINASMNGNDLIISPSDTGNVGINTITLIGFV